MTEQQKPKPLEELDYLALTIWAEARGEGTLGMQNVGHVIRNRVESGKFGGPTYQGVVTKPKQFSCWNPRDPNRKNLTIEFVEGMKPGTPDQRAMVQAYAIARQVMNRAADPTAGATHYHTKKVNPVWAQNLRKIAVVGNHIFYT